MSLENTDQKVCVSVGLVDDDPVFCAIMKNLGESRGITIETFESMEDVGFIGKFADYSLVILDYDLGAMNGLEIAEYFPAFFKKTPIVLVSGSKRSGYEKLKAGKNIKAFVQKRDGMDKIFDTAIDCLYHKNNETKALKLNNIA